MLTAEQTAIINSTGDIKINAVAGSGKTTTLIEYARARPKQRILYLAFNKAVKLEAEKKFAEKGLTNVRIDTAHSLAYYPIVRGNNYTVKTEGYSAPEIVELLGLHTLTGRQVEYIMATHILGLVAYFCNSDKAKVQELDYAAAVQDKDARQFVTEHYEQIVLQARVLLDKMNRGEIAVTHDFYLKKYQLSRPVLNYDIILFDEGQDASEAMLAVFLSQRATKVIVGDTHQQIYSWRYAVNSLDKADYPCFNLSASFRFGEEVAALAQDVIGWKKHLKQKAQVQIRGLGKPGKITTRACIARTNAGLLVKAIELLIEKKEIKTVYFEGRIESYTYASEGASIYDVLNLYNGQRDRIRDKMVASMRNLKELEDYIDNTADPALRMLVDIVKEYGTKIPGYIKKIKDSHLTHDDKSKADMIFSTVHRCKGLEYDEVTLADDFITEKKLIRMFSGKEKVSAERLAEEINLLYVAVTRTRSELYFPDSLLPESTEKAPYYFEKTPDKPATNIR